MASEKDPREVWICADKAARLAVSTLPLMMKREAICFRMVRQAYERQMDGEETGVGWQ